MNLSASHLPVRPGQRRYSIGDPDDATLSEQSRLAIRRLSLDPQGGNGRSESVPSGYVGERYPAAPTQPTIIYQMQPAAPPAPQIVYATAPSSMSMSTSASAAGTNEIVWKGTTWPYMCCSPLCCSSTHWSITQKTITTRHGCCGSKRDILDLRRIRDMDYHCTAPCCCCRGRVNLYTTGDQDAEIHITTWHAARLFKKLQAAREGVIHFAD